MILNWRLIDDIWIWLWSINMTERRKERYAFSFVPSYRTKTSSEMKGQDIVTFFKHNRRDISLRRTIEWNFFLFYMLPMKCSFEWKMLEQNEWNISSIFEYIFYTKKYFLSIWYITSNVRRLDSLNPRLCKTGMLLIDSHSNKSNLWALLVLE